MAALREVAARFKIEADTRQAQNLNQSIDGLVGTLRTAAGFLAGGVIVNGIKNWIKGSIDLGDSLDKTSRQISISAFELQRWSFAAERWGASQATIVRSFRLLQRNAFDASTGMKEAQDTFRELGLEYEDQAGNLKAPPELLLDLARAMEQLDNPTAKTALAMRALGRSGTELVPLLSSGEAGVRELFERFEELGGGFGQDFVDAAAEAQDALTDFDTASQSLRSRIAVLILPTITEWFNRFSLMAAELGKLTANTEIFKAAAVVLGGILGALAIKGVIAFAGPLLTAGLLILAVAALILIFEDFFGLMEGKDSLIGGVLNNILDDTNASHVAAKALREDWELIQHWIYQAGRALADFVDLEGDVLDAIGATGLAGDLHQRARDVRANVAESPREARQRRDAEGIALRQAENDARRGVVAQRRGESAQEALFRTNALRNQLGLGQLNATFGDTGQITSLLPETPADARARQARRAEIRAVGPAERPPAQINNNTTINVQGTPTEQIRRIRQTVGDELDRRDREILDALEPGDE